MESIIKDYLINESGFIDHNISSKKIYYKDIIYIEFTNYNRKTVLHMMNGKEIKTNYPLKHWIESLKNLPFCQTYKSFLINLNHVSGVNKNNIIMINEEEIPLSRHYKNDFENANIKNLYRII